MESSGNAQWERLRRALGEEPLPAAICDLDAFEKNAAFLISAARTAKKKLRIATKSLRCPELVGRLLEMAGETAAGLMTFAAAETAFLAKKGHRDLLLAYPTLHPRDCALLAEANKISRAAVAVDDWQQVEAIAKAGVGAGLRIPLIIDIDASYRPLQSPRVHLGVRRSPLRDPIEIGALAERISNQPGVSFHGLLSYEAQVAGLADRGAGALMDRAIRAMKHRSLRQLKTSRAQVAAELKRRNLPLEVFNGGGTGSITSPNGSEELTELTAGSGFFASHLFDRYDGISLEAALSLALQVTRRPAAHLATCAGGGIIASGEAGPSRLPVPWLPQGMKLLAQEGAGEVQTPLQLPDALDLPLGAPVFFRPAKAGEPLERFNEVLLVRGDRIEARAKTYRGEGFAFL